MEEQTGLWYLIPEEDTATQGSLWKIKLLCIDLPTPRAFHDRCSGQWPLSRLALRSLFDRHLFSLPSQTSQNNWDGWWWMRRLASLKSKLMRIWTWSCRYCATRQVDCVNWLHFHFPGHHFWSPLTIDQAEETKKFNYGPSLIDQEITATRDLVTESDALVGCLVYKILIVRSPQKSPRNTTSSWRA